MLCVCYSAFCISHVCITYGDQKQVSDSLRQKLLIIVLPDIGTRIEPSSLSPIFDTNAPLLLIKRKLLGQTSKLWKLDVGHTETVHHFLPKGSRSCNHKTWGLGHCGTCRSSKAFLFPQPFSCEAVHLVLTTWLASLCPKERAANTEI